MKLHIHKINILSGYFKFHISNAEHNNSPNVGSIILHVTRGWILSSVKQSLTYDQLKQITEFMEQLNRESAPVQTDT